MNCMTDSDNTGLFPGYLSLHIHIHPLYAPNQYIFLWEVVPSMPSGQYSLQTPRQTGNFLFLSYCHPFFGANIRWFIRWRKVTALPCSGIKNSWPVSPNIHHSIKYAPSITGQGISTVVLLYKERAFQWHKDNTKSGYIRRRTFSPTNISPVLQMIEFKLCGRIKPAQDIYYQFIFENHVYYLYFCRRIVRFFRHSTFD